MFLRLSPHWFFLKIKPCGKARFPFPSHFQIQTRGKNAPCLTVLFQPLRRTLFFSTFQDKYFLVLTFGWLISWGGGGLFVSWQIKGFGCINPFD
jgi:hypothetical protein